MLASGVSGASPSLGTSTATSGSFTVALSRLLPLDKTQLTSATTRDKYSLSTTTEQYSHQYTHAGSLMKTYLLDSTPCGISQVNDVATLKLELFPVLDCVTGVHAGQRRTAEGAPAVKIDTGAVKLKLDLCRGEQIG